MLHIDIPTPTDIERLAAMRGAACVSVYLPTSPVTQEAGAARLEFKNLVKRALDQLVAGGTSKHDVAALEELAEELLDDEPFWMYLSNSLAVFLTPHDIRTFRLPNRLTAVVEVSDRFYVKPLLRAVAFPQVAFVLAVSQNSVRLIEVAPDVPAFQVRVQDLPDDAASAVGKSSIADRSPIRRIQGSEGAKVRLRQYARAVDRALRPVLTGMDVPLVLAAAEPLASIYRSVNNYAHLAAESIDGSPDTTSDAALADAARVVLDGIYRDEVTAVWERLEQGDSRGLVARDLGDVARAATYGAIDTLLVDIDRYLPGFVDEESGTVTLTESGDAVDYGVIDEIARRALRSGARVLAVRSTDIPDEAPVIALMRFPV